MTGEKRADPVAAYLAEVKEHCRRSDLRTPAGAGYAIRSAQHVPRLVAAVEAVLALAHPGPIYVNDAADWDWALDPAAVREAVARGLELS